MKELSLEKVIFTMVTHEKTSRRLQLKIISYNFLKAVFVLIKNINLTGIPLEEDVVIFKYAVRALCYSSCTLRGCFLGMISRFRF